MGKTDGGWVAVSFIFIACGGASERIDREVVVEVSQSVPDSGAQTIVTEQDSDAGQNVDAGKDVQTDVVQPLPDAGHDAGADAGPSGRCKVGPSTIYTCDNATMTWTNSLGEKCSCGSPTPHCISDGGFIPGSECSTNEGCTVYFTNGTQAYGACL